MTEQTTLVRRRRDAGATPVTVVIGIGILVALFAGVITTMGAVASNESSGAQHAADAAALGGARGVLDDLPTDLLLGFTTPADIPLMVGGGTCLGNGRGEAARLASANGADLTSYCYNVWADEVSVSVQAALHGGRRGQGVGQGRSRDDLHRRRVPARPLLRRTERRARRPARRRRR